MDRAHDLALRALRVDPNLPQAHAALGAALLWKPQHDASIEAFERARALNPNFTDWRFSAAPVYAVTSRELSVRPDCICGLIPSTSRLRQVGSA